MSGTSKSTSVSDTCHALHQLLGGLTAFRFPYTETEIPRNGVYVVFEDGELAHGTNRIVRIGTHTGNDQLRSRLKQHFLDPKKDRSIFRKNIGRCLLKRADDPFLKFWELDLTSRAAKNEYAAKIDFEKQNEIEGQVSEYIRSHLRFVVFEVRDKTMRLDLESKLISTVSLCDKCNRSPTWLGQHSPKSKISSGKLWQENELHKTPLSDDEFRSLRIVVGVHA